MVSNGQPHNPMMWAPRRFPSIMASPYYGFLPPGAPATYHSAPGALSCGKFPNPKSVLPYLGNNKEAQMFLSRGAQVIIRMRGLPYNASPKEVIDFFADGDSGCKVLEEEGGVLFVRKPDGRATGDAFVLFAEEDDAEKALQKHKEIMGTRYIELFRSTTAEVQQVLNRTMEVHAQKQNHHNNHQHQQQQQQQQQQARDMLQLPLINTLPMPLPVHQHQQVITAGTLKDCIRLRGLPYEADVEQILNFLGEHGKNIVEHGIHMVVNAQGQPSGEAFIQMRGERDAFLAAQQRHHQYMVFGKKQRYIEVFQCSGDDMNHLLTGSGPMSAAAANQAAAMAAAVASQAKNANPGLLPPGHMFSPPHMSMGPFSYNPSSMLHHHHNAAAMAASAVAALGASFPTSFSAPPPPPLLYWPYPSPPISPNNYYSTLAAANGGASHHLQSLPPISNGHHHQSMMSQTSLPISPPMHLSENGRCGRLSEHISAPPRIKENGDLVGLTATTTPSTPATPCTPQHEEKNVVNSSHNDLTSSSSSSSLKIESQNSIELFPAV